MSAASATQAQPWRDRGDLERLAPHVDHRRHEVEREARNGNRVGPPERRVARLVRHTEPPRARVASAHHAIQEDDRHEEPPGPGRVREQLPHADAGHQVGEDRRATDEQQQLQLAAHAPSGIATVVPFRAATYACSTTLATRRMSSRKGPAAAPGSPRSSAATNRSNKPVNQRWYAVFSSSAE